MKKSALLSLVCILFFWQNAFSQTPVRGTVLDETGAPLPGASVKIKGTQSGTITNIDGQFQIEVSDESDLLLIEAVGYYPLEIAAGDGSQNVNVTLQISTQAVDEIVVVGYGTQTRKTLIGGTAVVKEDAFENVPVGSFTNMLQGEAPGVQITGQNGRPGAPAFIRIRGVGSITGGNQPLIVIDGVPSTAEAMNALNPNDIMDVSILKDASTTAIYGSRGSNGVLIVTTKRGADNKGAPKITYGFQQGWKSKTPDKFDMMSFDEKLRYERELGYTNEYLGPLIAADGYASVADVPDSEIGRYWDQLRPYETDWMDELLRTGQLQQHDLSIQGSTDKLGYFFSLQSYDEDGISVGSFYNRKSGNLSVDYTANDWLKVGQNIRFSYSKDRLLRDRFNAQNPFYAMYAYNPYESPYDYSGNGYNGYNWTTQGFNIIEGIQASPSWEGNMYGLSNTYLELTPLRDFKFRTQLGLQYASLIGENFLKPGAILDFYTNGNNPLGSKSDFGRYRFNYVWTNTAEYRKTLNDVHNITVLVGTEFTKDHFKTYSFNSIGFPLSGELTTQENGATPMNTTSSKGDWTLFSLFGRAEYNFDDRFSANVSFRRDGSSRFGPDVKYGNFAAFGAAWDISEERFMLDVPEINFLKLWGTIGTSGSDQIGSYAHMSLYSYTNYANQIAVYNSQAGNDELSWEKNTNYSFGLEYGLFQNRVSGNFVYYNRYTHALLLNRPLSPTTGFVFQPSNIGGMRNSGLEILLNVDIIRSKDFRWSAGGNITFNKNRITELLDDGEDIPNPNTFGTMWSVDRPIDVWYLKKFAGVDPENGDELWYTEDMETTNDYNDAAEFYIEDRSPDPKHFGGFYTSFSYKGLQLNVDFSFAGGHYTYNNQWLVANSAENVYQNMAANALDYWTPENTDASLPRADFNTPGYDSDRWLQKASILRLRNVTLAYNLPANWISRLKMQALRVYVQGQNLWYHAPGYKGDPEVGYGSDESFLTRPGNISLYSYPQTRAITFGLNVTF